MIFLPLILIPYMYVSASSKDMDPRTVNLALETSFLFDPYTDRHHLPLLKNMRSILDSLYNALSPSNSMRATSNPRGEILTNFLEKVAKVILKYEDNDLISILKVIHEEIERFYAQKKNNNDSMVRNPELRIYVIKH